MIVKRLEVKNYKSLKEFEIDFGKFNVLVGKNASGKSNIIDCLKFIHDLSSPTISSILDPIRLRGGYSKIIFGGNVSDNIEISIEFEIDSKTGKYSILFNESGMLEEELEINGESLFRYSVQTGARYINKEGEITERGASRIFYYEYDLNPLAQKFVKFIKSWRFYKFNIPRIRDVYGAVRKLELNEDGSNLAQVLLSLRTEKPKVFEKVEDKLKALIPEVEELLTPLTEDGKTYIAIREKGFEEKFDYKQISDGTIVLLAYITAINLGSGLVCFEEPENFVHPHLLKNLVNILRDGNQVIISTHSPYFLDWVEPEELIIVEKEEGKTKARRLKEEEVEIVKKSLEEGITLGEYYFSAFS